MKPLRLVFLATAAACSFASAAETASTSPVGYVSLGDTTPGQPAIKANTDAHISIPLERVTVFAGLVQSVTGSTITVSGTPGFGNFSSAQNPYFVRIASGELNGLVALVTANTDKTLTISPQVGESLSKLAASDKIIVTEAWTLGKLLGTDLSPGTQLLGFSGSFAGQNPSADLIYEFNGSHWIDTNSFEQADNAVLYPNEMLIVRNGATPIEAITVFGQVPTTKSRVVIAGKGSDNMISYFSPLDETLGSSGLSAIASAGDQILGYDNSAAGTNKAATTILEFNGSKWIDTNTFDDVTQTFKLTSGAGYVLRRASSAPAGNSVWADEPDYLSSL